MKVTGSRLLWLSTVLVLIGTALACGGNIELESELQAQLDEYENLIETFEPKFAEARGDTAKFADVADSYNQRLQAWMTRWSTVAATLSDEEGKAVQASMDRLNKRALRMLQGG